MTFCYNLVIVKGIKASVKRTEKNKPLQINEKLLFITVNFHVKL